MPIELKLEWGESGKESQERGQFRVGGLGARPGGTGQVEGTDKAQAKAVSDRPPKRSDRRRSADLQRGQGLGHSLEGSAKPREGFQQEGFSTDTHLKKDPSGFLWSIAGWGGVTESIPCGVLEGASKT